MDNVADNIEEKEFDSVEHDPNVDFVCKSFLEGLLPPPDMDIAEWAEKYRILPRAHASEHGQWHNERTPYLVEIMHELSPQSPADEVAFMKPVQVGGTELLINFVLYSMMYDPCPIGVFEPDENLTRALMDRINAAADEMGLADKLFDTDNLYEKSFPGGHLYAGWSSSESQLRSKPMKKVAGDETGSWVKNCQGYGDPIDLMKGRTTTFAQKKIFTCSTPGVNIPAKNETCRIYARYMEGDQRVFKVPCPHCGVLHEMRWSNDGHEGEPEFHIHWDKDEQGNDLEDTACMVCPDCGQSFSESYKTEIMKCGVWVPANPSASFPSFRLNAFYSPLGWCSWRQIVHAVLEAKRSKSREKMQVVVNNYFGEPWVDEEEETIDTDPLSKRCEFYGAEVPDGVIVLTASWDTQDNRIEAEVRGWGRNRENWAIKKEIFVGNTKDSTDPCWSRLDEFLMRPFKKADGTTLYVATALGDAMGHATDAVYSFTASRKSRRIFSCKGHSDRSKPLAGLPKITDKGRQFGAPLVMVCVDMCKDMLFSWVKNEKPGTAGYMHFPRLPEYDKAHFKQLAAEKLVIKIRNGKTNYVYVKTKERNEAIDLFDYQLAGLHLLQIGVESLNRFANAGRVMQYSPQQEIMQTHKVRRQLSSGVSV